MSQNAKRGFLVNRETVARALFALGTATLLNFGTPAVVQAGIECTQDYLECIDQAHNMPNPERQLAYFECSAEYAGCVRKKLLGI